MKKHYTGHSTQHSNDDRKMQTKKKKTLDADAIGHSMRAWLCVLLYLIV